MGCVWALTQMSVQMERFSVLLVFLLVVFGPRNSLAYDPLSYGFTRDGDGIYEKEIPDLGCTLKLEIYEDGDSAMLCLDALGNEVKGNEYAYGVMYGGTMYPKTGWKDPNSGSGSGYSSSPYQYPNPYSTNQRPPLQSFYEASGSSQKTDPLEINSYGSTYPSFGGWDGHYTPAGQTGRTADQMSWSSSPKTKSFDDSSSANMAFLSGGLAPTSFGGTGSSFAQKSNNNQLGRTSDQMNLDFMSGFSHAIAQPQTQPLVGDVPGSTGTYQGVTQLTTNRRQNEYYKINYKRGKFDGKCEEEIKVGWISNSLITAKFTPNNCKNVERYFDVNENALLVGAIDDDLFVYGQDDFQYRLIVIENGKCFLKTYSSGGAEVSLERINGCENVKGLVNKALNMFIQPNPSLEQERKQLQRQLKQEVEGWPKENYGKPQMPNESKPVKMTSQAATTTDTSKHQNKFSWLKKMWPLLLVVFLIPIFNYKR